MHNIATPELPKSVKVARDDFLEQQREQELMLQQQQRASRAQRAGNQKLETTRDISHNPGAGRPQIHLKTPRSNTKQPPGASLNSTNTKSQKVHYGDSQERPQQAKVAGSEATSGPQTSSKDISTTHAGTATASKAGLGQSKGGYHSVTRPAEVQS